ncbi:ABC transporter ATP-binding protein [Saccharopolyspora sp. TS4A08]|uniref:ABC transporter ATP-binding protein n=1 Tax=Saccharopolyspora ipomoeae TaxID=3042027 RepID=A0ABT6PRD5_9PSEU|nr:ABC transporter ATP-binding protein [Saccharopolyspora sp. TS4A08]MDI2030574.1 ABC transporter ATP-binding protein [Saccharopolyspora sp. TS4A08]
MKVGVEALELTYGEHRAVKNLDLTIPDGSSVVLLGQSGCGKTSTMRCIAGLESPSGGRITIGERTVYDGASGTSIPSHKRNVGMVFQSYAVWPHMTVLDNVAFPLKMKGVGRAEARRKAIDVLEVVGLGHLGERGASMLSGGQMQRVALARSMAMEPAVLLLDEPLSNLDARLRDELRVELRRIQLDRGLTSLYVTHDQQEALALADRIAIMQGGRITQLGTPEEIYAAPASASIASFLGVTNVFEVDSLDGNRAVLADQGGQLLVDEAEAGIPGTRFACIRPEHVRVTPATGEGAATATNRMRGTVEVAVFQGASIRCTVRTGTGLAIEAICPPPVTGTLATGSEVSLEVDARAVRLLPEDVTELQQAQEVVAV